MFLFGLTMALDGKEFEDTKGVIIAESLLNNTDCDRLKVIGYR
jgi:hypothetical protein